MIPLPPDFKEFLQALNRSEVKYLLTGGYAVAYHGYPRTTADLDVWIQVDPGNARRVMAALEQFGLGRAGASPELFLKPRQVIRMGVAPLRIEILTGVSGLEFETGFARRCREMLDGWSLASSTAKICWPTSVAPAGPRTSPTWNNWRGQPPVEPNLNFAPRSANAE